MKRRRTQVFRIVLNFSRKGYSEAVYRQTTEDFIRCIENAFWHFSGVPKVLVIDNLKAAVTKPDWHDPELNPKIQSFCEHYGVTILPTKPRTPRHKGKVENSVGWCSQFREGLASRSFIGREDTPPGPPDQDQPDVFQTQEFREILGGRSPWTRP
ncbi:MAG: DDE-type integrase/transposase/recombinase [Pirellulales bacterium]